MRAGTVWLTACVLLVAGCADDSEPREAPDQDAASRDAAFDSGARLDAGDLDADSTVPPRVVAARRHASRLEIMLDHTEQAFDDTCYTGRAALLHRPDAKAEWQALRDDVPITCGASYYLDGRYAFNGCDFDCVNTCSPIGPTLSLSTIERIQVGTRPAPDAGMAFEDAGTSDDGGEPEFGIPVIESMDTTGPYMLELTYHGGSCDGPLNQVRLALPSTP